MVQIGAHSRRPGQDGEAAEDIGVRPSSLPVGGEFPGDGAGRPGSPQHADGEQAQGKAPAGAPSPSGSAWPTVPLSSARPAASDDALGPAWSGGPAPAGSPGPSGRLADPLSPSGRLADPLSPSGRLADPLSPSGRLADPLSPSGRRSRASGAPGAGGGASSPSGSAWATDAPDASWFRPAERATQSSHPGPSGRLGPEGPEQPAGSPGSPARPAGPLGSSGPSGAGLPKDGSPGTGPAGASPSGARAPGASLGSGADLSGAEPGDAGRTVGLAGLGAGLPSGGAGVGLGARLPAGGAGLAGGDGRPGTDGRSGADEADGRLGGLAGPPLGGLSAAMWSADLVNPVASARASAPPAGAPSFTPGLPGDTAALPGNGAATPGWPAAPVADGNSWAAAGDGGRGGPSGQYGGGDHDGPGSRRRTARILGIAAVVALLAAAGGGYLYLQKTNSAQAAGTGRAGGRPVAAKGPESVVSVTPADGATDVNGAAPIRVVFAKPLSPDSPMPTLKPAIKGTWTRSGNTAVFTPARGFWQRTRVTLTIPGGRGGVLTAAGGTLPATVTDHFRTGTFKLGRLDELLAQLGYLPLTWAPSPGQAVPQTDPQAQLSAAYAPPAGTYTWQAGYPAMLHRLWRANAPSQVLRGAVAAFQADHGLMADMIAENQLGLQVGGAIGRRLWHAMFRAIERNEVNTHGYTYAIASQHLPETLTVWHDGRMIFHHLANTGIPVSPTAVRTDPVYIRYRTQIMRGTNPNGTKYADPVAWVAYFHAGEAVHYFPRASYGFPQSLGCVELPYSEAEWIWPYLTYGTLVTVTKP